MVLENSKEVNFFFISVLDHLWGFGWLFFYGVMDMGRRALRQIGRGLLDSLAGLNLIAATEHRLKRVLVSSGVVSLSLTWSLNLWDLNAMAMVVRARSSLELFVKSHMLGQSRLVQESFAA